MSQRIDGPDEGTSWIRDLNGQEDLQARSVIPFLGVARSSGFVRGDQFPRGWRASWGSADGWQKESMDLPSGERSVDVFIALL